jgi:hypothetical protein
MQPENREERIMGFNKVANCRRKKTAKTVFNVPIYHFCLMFLSITGDTISGENHPWNRGGCGAGGM